MDGFKRRVGHSLQTRLCLWLSIVLLCSALIAGLLAFQSAFQEVHELQDDMLRQIAAMYDLQRLQFHGGLDLGGKVVRDDESRVFVELLPSGASPGAAVSPPPVALPPGLPDGIHSVRAGHKTYRVLIKTLGKGGRLAVAQETEVRDEIARDNALHTIMPFLILIPVLLLVVSGLVRKIFVPVRQLSAEIDRRGDKDLHRIASESLPKEIRPFVEAINSLLGRVEQSLSAQLRFVADAAHELRSPLTALSLQAERLSESEMSSRAHARLDTLRKGIERGRVLVEQLLALARVQASAITPGVRSSGQQAYRCVLEDLLPLAEIKNIDIGVTSDFDALVPLDEVSLITLVKNLVNNAIVYTPVGGCIDLSVALGEGGVTMLVVEDSGPGIPEAERNRVFDPFHRIPGSDQIGSGLGLSIVRAIASRCDAAVHLDFADEQSKSGLRVTVVFPVS
jgi:two-component system, OmpR family, sensor kinase